MEGQSCRFRFGPLVLGVLIGGAVLRRLAGCEHPARRHWRHDHFARAWRTHHTGFHRWACHYPQGEASAEKSEEAA